MAFGCGGPPVDNKKKKKKKKDYDEAPAPVFARIIKQEYFALAFSLT